MNMNSNISITSNTNIEQSISKASSNIIENSNFKKLEENEQNDLKNLRIESSLSLRKKKLNEIIFSKRLKQLNIQNNLNDEDLYVNFNEIKNNIPAFLSEEFDIYEDKLSVIHQILSKNYSILHGLQFDERNLMKFIIYKLTDISYSNKDLFEDKENEKDLLLVFYDIIKLINENNEKKIVFATTTILVNFIYHSKILAQEFHKVNIWKRLAEITELKNPELNDNIATMMTNLYSSFPEVGKEYILSNYSRYIKQILTNYFITFIEESKKESIDLNIFLTGIIIIKKLISKENKNVKKENDFDVVVKMKFIYDYLTKVFIILSSWILNKLSKPKHQLIFKLISSLLECFSEIGNFIDEETYEMQEFKGESFVTSYCSLLKFLILNKEKEVQSDYILDVLKNMYNFLGIIFSISEGKSEIFARNKLIIITEEFIKNINSMKEDLISKIMFFISNYIENENKAKEIFEESSIPIIIKDYINNNIYEERLSYNIFCLIENGFLMGGYNIKEIIIKNYSNFLVERIKILYNLIIRNDLKFKKYIDTFLMKCKLLLNIVKFLRYNSQTNLQLLKNLLEYIKLANIEEYVMNIRAYLIEEKDLDLFENFLEEFKK